MKQRQPIRVLLIDDHPLLRLGVARGLEHYDDIQMVGEFAQLTDAQSLLAAGDCDVLVLDYALPDASMDGLRLIQFIHRRYSAAIVLFTSHANAATAMQALDAGALGFVGKDSGIPVLALAIRSAARGQRFLAPEVEARLAEADSIEPNRDTRLKALSPREFEVVRLLTEGLAVTAIAHRLSRSVKTVSAQKSAAMRKLGARTDLELLRMLLERQQPS